MSKRLRGVFAAVATASTADREVDCAKSIALGHYLLQRLRWLERDMSYAREVAAISPDFDVFPSTEAVLLEARDGAFAGCNRQMETADAAVCAVSGRGQQSGGNRV